MKESSSSSHKNSTFRQKCRSLWKDKRTYRERLLLAAVPSFALCFTFIFFGPIEMTAFNQSSLSFSIFDITGMMLVAMAAAFVALTLVLSLLRGKVFNYCVTAVFAFLLCGYLQGNVLNGPLGALTGEPINWQIQKTAMLANMGVWALLFLASYLVLYFDKKVWRNVVLFGSALLVVMQGTALVGIYTGAERKETAYFSEKGMFEYAQQNNTVVFVVDMLDYLYIEQIRGNDPTFFDRLDGFTGFENATSEFARTRPAANYMLTGKKDGAYQVPRSAYLEQSWGTKTNGLLSDLDKVGYRVDLYCSIDELFSDSSISEKYVSNYSSDSMHMAVTSLTKNMLFLSLYRYSPVIAKPFFWLYTDDINEAAFQKDEVIQAAQSDETRLDAGLDGMQLIEENGILKLFHFRGSHYPYTLNADGTRSSTTTSVEEQTRGCFEVLFRALDRMKELGIYDDATIIISADHGRRQHSRLTPLDYAVRIGMFYKPAGKSEEPLTWSKAPVSLANIPATIIKSTGVDYSAYGKALDDVAEGDDVTRYCYNVILDEAGDEAQFAVFEVKGDASDFANWKNLGVQDVKYPFYE